MTATYAKFTLQLNTVTDADVIEYLKAQANKNDTMDSWGGCGVATSHHSIRKPRASRNSRV